MIALRLQTAFVWLVSLFLLASCSEPPATQGGAAAPQVTVARPLQRSITDWDGFVGQFQAVQQVDIRPRVSGYVVEVAFADGAVVERGDLLFRIDPRPFEAVLQQAKGQLQSVKTRVENQRKERDRAQSLLPLQAVSQEEYDSLEAAVLGAESDLQAATANVQAAQLNVDFTRITAPVAGRMSYRRIDVGNIVKADETLLTTLVSMDPIQFVFQGSEAMYLRYKRDNAHGMGGSPVRIRLQDETDYGWDGKLEFFDNAISAGSGTIRGRALVDNPDGFLVPGMFGHLQLQAAAPYMGILLPDDAIATRGAQRIVYVVGADSVVKAVQVELGPLNDGLRVIRSGLDGSERVVVSGLQRVFPGSAVDAVESNLAAITAR
ncbi:MAG TPA: efflux RND transporter periplasmic adaptor subunit [Hyphomicrobiales bacterium]|nr:efflux RND transporter periplasmic adaptor subunit [Hyphomicrobiales bacterium]